MKDIKDVTDIPNLHPKGEFDATIVSFTTKPSQTAKTPTYYCTMELTTNEGRIFAIAGTFSHYMKDFMEMFHDRLIDIKVRLRVNHVVHEDRMYASAYIISPATGESDKFNEKEKNNDD